MIKHDIIITYIKIQRLYKLNSHLTFIKRSEQIVWKTPRSLINFLISQSNLMKSQVKRIILQSHNRKKKKKTLITS